MESPTHLMLAVFESRGVVRGEDESEEGQLARLDVLSASASLCVSFGVCESELVGSDEMCIVCTVVANAGIVTSTPVL